MDQPHRRAYLATGSSDSDPPNFIVHGETLDAPTSLAVVPRSSPNLFRPSALRHGRGVVFPANVRACHE
eukprot:867230-Prymnesium_polylepis.1